jgi:hypothetical protein
MTHAQKTDFVFRRNRRVHLNRRGRQFGRLLAAEVWASALVMLDTPRSKVVWRVLATHSIRQFPLHFPSRSSPCAIRFQTHSTYIHYCKKAKFQLQDTENKVVFYSQPRSWVHWNVPIKPLEVRGHQVKNGWSRVIFLCRVSKMAKEESQNTFVL